MTPVDFTPWMFLATPLDELCELLGARLVTALDWPAGGQAAVIRAEGRLFLLLPDDDAHNRLECETAARAALAVTAVQLANKLGRMPKVGLRTGGAL